jgi:hypothetical protein
MNALRDRSRSIQFEAFHIFKIFAANPNKHPEVIHVALLPQFTGNASLHSLCAAAFLSMLCLVFFLTPPLSGA